MIKGLSEVRRIPRLGKIHLGKKKESQKGSKYPSAMDFFVVHPDENTSKEMTEKFYQIYGDKPKALNIIFPVENPEKFFPQWLKRYSKGILLCKGDGETAIETDLSTNQKKQIKCGYKNCPYFQKKYCRRIANLQFFLQEIPGGIWQIDTSAVNSIISINSAIDIIKAQNNGHIAGIPLKLTLVPMQVTVEGRKKTIYVLNLYQDSINEFPQKQENKHEKIHEESDDILPDTDDVPEDLFPNDIDSNENDEPVDLPDFEPIDDIDDPFTEITTGTKYGQLKVENVKTLKNNNTGEIFYGLTCVDNKNIKHNIVSQDNVVEQLTGKSLIEYELEPVNDHLEKLISYKILEDVQEA